LNIEDRLERLAMNKAFVTIKDHKENFVNNPQCRLVNPAKPELGKVSKVLLDNINHNVRNATHVHQWHSTNNVIKWFKSIPNKNICTFIQYDIDEFYPSISQQLLHDSLRHAKKFTKIPDKSIEIPEKLYFFQETICGSKIQQTQTLTSLWVLMEQNYASW